MDDEWDISRIAQWVCMLSIDKHREIDPRLNTILEQLSVMGEGPEFEWSREELYALVVDLNED